MIKPEEMIVQIQEWRNSRSDFNYHLHSIGEISKEEFDRRESQDDEMTNKMLDMVRFVVEIEVLKDDN